MRKMHSVKRYRAPKDLRAQLGQVMTPQPMADALIRLLGGFGGRWLELGSGSGRLAEAAYKNASPLSYLGVELETSMIDLCAKLPNCQYLEHDVLSATSLAHLLGEQQFDHVIGNPPYGMYGLPPQTVGRLLELCPETDVPHSWAPIDLYFVLESLARVKSTGSGAFIVGADIPCGAQSLPFRKALVDQASEIECYELPNTAFGFGVEVQAYMLIVRFGRHRAKHVSLGRLDEHYEVESLRFIDKSQAIESMALSYHEFDDMHDALYRSSHGVTMKDLGVSITRGSRSRSQFSQLGIAHFHTSDFPKSGMEISLESNSVPSYQQATVGDILLPRVGTRCLEHKAVVVSGQSPYSESVFRVRAPSQHQDRIVRWLTSDKCASWRLAAARGACAKHLTVSALLGMPVPL